MNAEEKVEIMKKHSAEFLEPILIMLDVMSLQLPKAELMQNKDFKKVGLMVKEIKRQGFKEPFMDFLTIVLRYIKDGV